MFPSCPLITTPPLESSLIINVFLIFPSIYLANTILFMSSTSNIIPNPAAFGYYSSKYLLFKSIEYLNKNKSNLYKAIILGPVETNISRNLEIPKGLSKLLLDFLNIRPELVVKPIEKFLLNKKSYLYFTLKAYIVYNIIYPILKIFPFLYTGPRKD